MRRIGVVGSGKPAGKEGANVDVAPWRGRGRDDLR